MFCCLEVCFCGGVWDGGVCDENVCFRWEEDGAVRSLAVLLSYSEGDLRDSREAVSVRPRDEGRVDQIMSLGLSLPLEVEA